MKQLLFEMTGSLQFLAPELLEESNTTVHTDIYAYACTCIEQRPK
jgi:hypothetical protein